MRGRKEEAWAEGIDSGAHAKQAQPEEEERFEASLSAFCIGRSRRSRRYF